MRCEDSSVHLHKMELNGWRIFVNDFSLMFDRFVDRSFHKLSKKCLIIICQVVAKYYLNYLHFHTLCNCNQTQMTNVHFNSSLLCRIRFQFAPNCCCSRMISLKGHNSVVISLRSQLTFAIFSDTSIKMHGL